jgi:hypothetical protein
MFLRATLATITVVTLPFPAWGQVPLQPPIAERVHAILDEARAQPVEVFADVSFALLDKLSTKDRVAALKEVFERADQAHAGLPLQHALPAAPNSRRSVLDLALVLDRVHSLKVDALSLRCRVVQALLAIDATVARKLFDQIPRVEIPKTECNDEFVPDASIYTETAVAVAERGEFTKEERDEQAPWFLVESAVRFAQSSWDIATAAKALPSLARNDRQAAVLSAALAVDLNLSDSDREFTSAIRSGELVGNVLTASRTLHASGAPEILPQALRAFMVRQFRAVRCKDNYTESLGKDQANIFNEAIRGRADITPIAAEETVPFGLNDASEQSKYDNDTDFRSLWNEADGLGPSGTKDFSTARLTADWGYRANQILWRIVDWKGVDGQDPVTVFHQKIALLHLLIDMAPAGETHRIAMDGMIAVLGDATILQKSPQEWLYEVRFAVDYFRVFASMGPEVGKLVEGFAFGTGRAIWQGLAESKLPALSIYGRIGLLESEVATAPGLKVLPSKAQ